MVRLGETSFVVVFVIIVFIIGFCYYFGLIQYLDRGKLRTKLHRFLIILLQVL